MRIATRPPSQPAPAPKRRSHNGFLIQVYWAVLYVGGVALLIIGVGGAYFWQPLLWCVPVGLVAITVALAVGTPMHASGRSGSGSARSS